MGSVPETAVRYMGVSLCGGWLGRAAQEMSVAYGMLDPGGRRPPLPWQSGFAAGCLSLAGGTRPGDRGSSGVCCGLVAPVLGGGQAVGLAVER